MFLIQLEFSTNKPEAPRYMEGHNAWLRRGFEDGIFLASGSLRTHQGGAVLAANTSLEALHEQVAQDPFVEHDVVRATIVEFGVAKAAPRLEFLVEQ